MEQASTTRQPARYSYFQFFTEQRIPPGNKQALYGWAFYKARAWLGLEGKKSWKEASNSWLASWARVALALMLVSAALM